MAYILGFIFADGCLVEYKNGYHGLDITSKDLGHLRLIKEQLKAEHKIGEKERGYRIQVRNSYIYNDLLKLGLTPRKSKTIAFPEIPKSYFSHFIRGLFDGDGSVMVWREPRWRHTWQIRTSFTSGSQNFLQDLKKQLQSLVGLSRGRVSPVTRGFHLRYLSMPECIALYKFMYQGNNNLYLRRKRDKFESFLSFKKLENKR
ncbi:MAG: LAGLIDADG family homing endonuclease [Candidatus Omnitrophota bacterium]|nr:LAGLIDADG family homing endonuclease [Candidatus Omnitrophota bacterium]